MEPGRTIQLPLIILVQRDTPNNGFCWQWFTWDGRPVSIRTFQRIRVAGSDGFQDGDGCPVAFLSDEGYRERYLLLLG